MAAYLLMNGPWRICHKDIVFSEHGDIKVPQIGVHPLRRKGLLQAVSFRAQLQFAGEGRTRLFCFRPD